MVQIRSQYNGSRTLWSCRSSGKYSGFHQLFRARDNVSQLLRESNMSARMKPICGMWATLMLLSVAMTFLDQEGMSKVAEPIFGMWPSMIIIWLVVALFFDWVIQSTGMRVIQAAIVLALAGVLTLTGEWMFEGLALSRFLFEAVVALVYWVLAATVYGKLSR